MKRLRWVSVTVGNFGRKYSRAILLSMLASGWTWLVLLSPARRKSIRLQDKILEIRTRLEGARQEESRLRAVKHRLSVLESELRLCRDSLWPAVASFLSHVDSAAVRARVQIGRLTPVHRERAEDGARSWKCDVEGSFGRLVNFLGELNRAPRTVGIRELSIQPVSSVSKSAQGLRLSLLLNALSKEDVDP